jgi:hypothetical protein
MQQSWTTADNPDLFERVEAYRIAIQLDQGQIDPAIAALRSFMEKHGQQKARVLVTNVVLAIRQRIEELQLIRGQEKKLKEWQAVYAEFAKAASQSMAGQTPEERYPYDQMRAEALLMTDQPAEAIELFEQLRQSQPVDARNIQGLARGHRMLKQYPQSLNLQLTVIRGLEDGSPEWWRAQLEFMQTAAEAYAGQPGQLQQLAIRYRQLQKQNSNFGGLLKEFNEVLRQIEHEVVAAAS